MPPVVVIMMGFAFLCGLILLWVGLRGRRLNDHPVCRQCAFDLDGIYPESVTCPECGAGLKREGSVRVGARKRLTGVAALGLLLAMLPSAPLGVLGYAALTGSDVNAYLPVGVLLWSAQRATPAGSERIANELIRRAQAGQLSQTQYASAAEFGLKLQADPNSPWSEAWGNFLNAARLDGTLTPAGLDAFERQSALLKATTREKAASGASLPVTIALDQARVGSGDIISHSLSLDGATLDGKKVAAKVSGSGAMGTLGGGAFQIVVNGVNVSGGPGDDRQLGVITAAGSRVPLGVFGTGPKVTALVELPGDLTPGPHTIELQLTQEASAGRGVLGFPSFATGAGSLLTLRTTVEIVPVEQLVAPIAPTPDVDAKLAAMLRPGNISLDEAGFGQPNDGPNNARVSLRVKDLPVPLACDVLLRVGNDEWKIGEFHTGSDATSAPSGFSSSSFSYQVSVNGVVTSQSSSEDSREIVGPAKGLSATRADLVLRPRPEVALKTADLTRYYNGEIVIPGVPISRVEVPSIFREMRDLQKRQQERLRQWQNQRRPRGR